jgi:hypothetical protein
MTSLNIQIPELDLQGSYKATLHINFNEDQDGHETLTLSINDGDKFEFNLLDLERAVMAVKAIRIPDSW